MEKSKPSLPTLSGSAIVSLMRAQKVSIADAARLMNIPMTRVRKVREHGVQGSAFVQDWLDVIGGPEPARLTLAKKGLDFVRAKTDVRPVRKGP